MIVLFLCTGNSARSQMAEALMRSLLPRTAPIELHSAGTSPAPIHPRTLEVLQEVGVATEGLRSKGLDAVPYDRADLVVTLCGEAREACPVPPSGARAIHWGLRDPAAATNTPDELSTFRAVRDEILTCVKRLLFEMASDPALRPRRS